MAPPFKSEKEGERRSERKTFLELSAQRSRELSTQECRFVRPQSWEEKVCLKGRGKRWRGAGGAGGKEEFPDKRLP